MTTTLFVSQDAENNLAQVQEYIQTLHLHPADVQLADISGIAEVKQLQLDTQLAPLQGQHKAIIIPQAQTLTIPAQNALLKLLEEPPEHVYFFLLTTSLGALLPTVASRCQIIKRTEVPPTISDEDVETIQRTLTTWQSGTIGEKLYSAQQLTKEKEEFLVFLKKAEQVLHRDLVAGEKEKSLLLIAVLKLKEIVTSTNVSARMALEETLLTHFD